MSNTDLLNKLAEKENSFNDEAIGSTALYYGEIENVLSDEQIRKLAKLSKYDKYFRDKTTEDFKKIIKDTNKKRGICQSLLNKNNNEIYFNVPYGNYEDTNDTEFSYHRILNEKNNTVFNNINTNDIPSIKSQCKLFYATYCENLKEQLKQTMGDSYSDEYLATYNSECSCYADRLKDKKELNPNDSFYNQFPDSYLNSIHPHCEFASCVNENSNYAPMTIADTPSCGNVTICTNTVNFDDFDISDKSSLDILSNLSNNCGNNSNFAKSLENKDKKKDSSSKDNSGSSTSKQDIPEQDIPKDIPEQNIPEQNIPKDIPEQNIPEQNIPKDIPKDIPEKLPSNNNSDFPTNTTNISTKSSIPESSTSDTSKSSITDGIPEKTEKKKNNKYLYLIIGGSAILLILLIIIIIALL